MNTLRNLKITGFFQITQSILLVLIYNVLLVSVFPPDLSSGAIIPDILYILSSQILGFLFSAITMAFLFKVFSIGDYLIIDINVRGVLYAFAAFVLATLSINGADYFQKSLIPIYLLSSYLSMSLELQDGYRSIALMLTNIHPSMLYLVGALLPAICEEFFFRGYLLQLSMKHYSAHISLIWVSAIFAFMHFQLVAILPLFIFGYILGYLTLKTGRLSYAVLVHFLNNALTLYVVSSM